MNNDGIKKQYFHQFSPINYTLSTILICLANHYKTLYHKNIAIISRIAKGNHPGGYFSDIAFVVASVTIAPGCEV